MFWTRCLSSLCLSTICRSDYQSIFFFPWVIVHCPSVNEIWSDGSGEENVEDEIRKRTKENCNAKRGRLGENEVEQLQKWEEKKKREYEEEKKEREQEEQRNEIVQEEEKNEIVQEEEKKERVQEEEKKERV